MTRDLKADLKRKLWAAIDELGDADGFVLTATADDVVFTYLKARQPWSDGCVLDLDPLNAAVAQREAASLRADVTRLESRKVILGREVEKQERRLADLNAAIATALGKPADGAKP